MMSLKPSLFQSPAELTENPVKELPEAPVNFAPGTAASAGATDQAQVDETNAVDRCCQGGEARAAVDQVGECRRPEPLCGAPIRRSCCPRRGSH